MHEDKIYRTRENRRYCDSKGIRLSGPPMGRPRTITEANAEQRQHDKQQAYDDAIARIAIEGKFGQGKRRFGLGRLMAKLALTSETMIEISFLVMNLEHLLSRGVFAWLVSWWQGWLFAGKAPLLAQGNTRPVDFRDRSECEVESRGAEMVRLAA